MPEPTSTTTIADPTAIKQPTQPTEPAAGATPETWEAWLDSQPDNVKALYRSHSEGLLNTVKATRDERDTVKKQLKDLAKKAEEGSDLKKQLDGMTAQLEKTEKRAAFLEEAIKPEIQCRNPRAAWIVAEAAELFNKNGSPDWAAIKAEAPELFGAPTANANAGAGTQSPPPKQNDMNAFIRRKAGKA